MVTPRMFEKMFGRDSYDDEIYHDSRKAEDTSADRQRSRDFHGCTYAFDNLQLPSVLNSNHVQN
jgi:hypothetical protein